ncbi:MAG: hypothetical protein GX372_00815 [Ignavibacteria bacterium]|nr:hypothetical protein [Ignavibacteria bacterium]
MRRNGLIDAELETQNASYSIPEGYHDGNGKVTANITNLIPANIKKGVNVGGVEGAYEGSGGDLNQQTNFTDFLFATASYDTVTFSRPVFDSKNNYIYVPKKSFGSSTGGSITVYRYEIDENGLLTNKTGSRVLTDNRSTGDGDVEYLMKRSFIVPNCGVPIFNFSRFNKGDSSLVKEYHSMIEPDFSRSRDLARGNFVYGSNIIEDNKYIVAYRNYDNEYRFSIRLYTFDENGSYATETLASDLNIRNISGNNGFNIGSYYSPDGNIHILGGTGAEVYILNNNFEVQNSLVLDANDRIRDIIYDGQYYYMATARQVFKLDSSFTLLGSIEIDKPTYYRYPVPSLFLDFINNYLVVIKHDYDNSASGGSNYSQNNTIYFIDKESLEIKPELTFGNCRWFASGEQYYCITEDLARSKHMLNYESGVLKLFKK